MTTDQVIAGLQSETQQQKLTLDALEGRLELIQGKLKLTREEVALDLKLTSGKIALDLRQRRILGTVFGLVLAFLGWGTFTRLMNTIDEVVAKQVEIQIEKRLLFYDPTNVPIHVPWVYIAEELLERLTRFGFQNLKRYSDLSDPDIEGVVIVCLA